MFVSGFVSAYSCTPLTIGQCVTHVPLIGLPYWPVGHYVDLTQNLVELRNVLFGHFATQRFYIISNVLLIK